jgi:hypothetical protein
MSKIHDSGVEQLKVSVLAQLDAKLEADPSAWEKQRVVHPTTKVVVEDYQKYECLVIS